MPIPGVEARKGYLDLTTGAPGEDGLLTLGGEWEFYWQELLQPEDFTENTRLPGYIHLPAPWQGKSWGNMKLPPLGYATFRLRIQFNKEMDSLGLYIPNMDNAYSLWFNGSLISTNGKVGTNREEMRPQRLPRVCFVSVDGSEAEIIVQVSNYHHRNGGMTNGISIGSQQKINSFHDRGIAWEMFLFGSLFITGIYHLILSFTRKKENSSLFFGFFCIVIGIRILASGNYLLIYAFPALNWELGVKIEYLTFFGSLPLFSLYLFELFKSYFHKSILWIIHFVSLIFILFVLATPAIIYSQLALIPFQLFAILSCFYFIFILVKASVSASKEALFVLGGFLFIFLTAFVDILSSHSILTIQPLVPLGACIFIFSQSLLLSIKFARTYHELDYLSKNLENQVQSRTRELQQAKEEIEESHNEKMNFFVNLSHEIRTSGSCLAQSGSPQ